MPYVGKQKRFDPDPRQCPISHFKNDQESHEFSRKNLIHSHFHDLTLINVIPLEVCRIIYQNKNLLQEKNLIRS